MSQNTIDLHPNSVRTINGHDHVTRVEWNIPYTTSGCLMFEATIPTDTVSSLVLSLRPAEDTPLFYPLAALTIGGECYEAEWPALPVLDALRKATNWALDCLIDGDLVVTVRPDPPSVDPLF